MKRRRRAAVSNPYAGWSLVRIGIELTKLGTEIAEQVKNLEAIEAAAATAEVGAAGATHNTALAAAQANLQHLQNRRVALEAAKALRVAANAAAASGTEGAAAESGARWYHRAGKWILEKIKKPEFIRGTVARVAIAGVIVYVGANVAGWLAADRPIEAGPAMTRDPSQAGFSPVGFTPDEEAYTQRYFIYAVNTSGWSLYIARPAEVEGRPSHSFTDGGTTANPVEWKKLVDQPFYTETEARDHLKPLVSPSFDSRWTGHHVKFQGQDYRDVHVGKID
jgi:hypothetical protein